MTKKKSKSVWILTDSVSATKLAYSTFLEGVKMWTAVVVGRAGDPDATPISKGLMIHFGKLGNHVTLERLILDEVLATVEADATI